MSIEIIKTILTEEMFIKLFEKYHNRKPNGEFCHYCPSSAFVPIDSACELFKDCVCEKED